MHILQLTFLTKQLFFQYISKMAGEEGFIEPQIKELFEKEQTTAYLDDGMITLEAMPEDESSKHVDITFSGQVDSTNSQAMQDISINYSKDVTFPLSYKQIEDIIGIQTEYVGSKYVATTNTENSQIQNVEGLENLENITQETISQEDMEHIKETYLNVLNQQLQNSNFSKIEENDAIGYRLTLEGESLKNLIIAFLNTLKDDQTTLDIINKYTQISTKNIDSAVETINSNEELLKEGIEITVYQKEEKVNRLVIEINKVKIYLEKEFDGDNLTYNIEVQMDDSDAIEGVTFKAEYNGLKDMKSINEAYELSLTTKDSNYEYSYENSIEFTDSVDIEQFNDENCLLLDDLEEEQRTNLINAITERIQSVNQRQMEELGVAENENPLFYAIPQMFMLSSVSNMTVSDLNEEEIAAFNKKFENYQSTNLMGVTVKGLLSTIELNNESQEDDNRKIKEIHFDGEEYEVTEQTITLLKSNVETETAYRVEFERDENTGLIYRAVINKK